MTDLEDHAKRGDGPEIVLTGDLPYRPSSRIVQSELIDHDDLTEEGQFPQHGQFLKVETPEGEIEYWECPSSLAGAVIEIVEEREIEPVTSVLSVDQVSKTPSGEWRFVVDLSESS